MKIIRGCVKSPLFTLVKSFEAFVPACSADRVKYKYLNHKGTQSPHKVHEVKKRANIQKNKLSYRR
jgi:ribosomal protein S1